MTLQGSSIDRIRIPGDGPARKLVEESLLVARHADEEWLIERARHGDLDAFNALVERYQTAIFNLCMRMLGRRDAAEDATQDTFLAAYKSVGKLQGAHIGAWFLRIAANACYDELRRRGRRPGTSLDALLDDPQRSFTPATREPGPEDSVLHAEARRDIERALLQLPDDQRLAVILCDVEGLHYDEIAEVTRSSLGTVKSRISRGRSKMREILSAEGEHLTPGNRQQDEEPS
jgi:RNA polymerase sigma factor (sigma-70 family)